MIDPLMTVRAVHYAATVTVAGAGVFAPFVAEPAFRAVTAPPLRVIRSFRDRLSGLLLVSLAVAVISGAGWLLLLAASIDDRPLSEAVADGSAWVVLTQTRFGIDWQLRCLLAALLAANVLLKPLLRSHWRDLLAAVGGVAIVVTLAWGGMVGRLPETAAMSTLPQICFISLRRAPGLAASSRLCCCSGCCDMAMNLGGQ